MRLRAIGVAKDPTVVVEVASVVGLAKVTPATSGNGPDADRLRAPAQAAPVAAVTLPVTRSFPTVEGGQEVGSLLAIANGQWAFLLVAAIGATPRASATSTPLLLP